MPINTCTINTFTINSNCGVAFSILTASVVSYSATMPVGTAYGPDLVGTFAGGPVLGVSIVSGTLNGPGGTFAFTTDPGVAGNIYFGGVATTVPGVYTGTVRLQGLINYVDIVFTITVTAVAPTSGGHAQHVNPDSKLPMRYFRHDDDEQPYLDTLNLEQPFITVSVELNGECFSQTLERKEVDNIPLVLVTNFRKLSIDSVSISVSGIKLMGLTSSSISVNISDIKIYRIS